MRDVYTHGVVTGDFVLVYGDLVSSIRIEEAVAAHRERRKVNKDVIMTMVVKESGARHRTKYVSSILSMCMVRDGADDVQIARRFSSVCD